MFSQLCELTNKNNNQSSRLNWDNRLNRDNRLNWDEYFMSIALLASQRSPCSRLKVGSVVVKDNRLISMGYNGFLPGAPHISRLKDDHEQSIIHSEVNALADCAKRGTSLQGAKIYVTHYPCLNCFRSIAACGIKEIIYLNDYKNDGTVSELASDASINIRQLEPIPNSVSLDNNTNP